jgi:GNAT superfamily N-acetyltransferase
MAMAASAPEIEIGPARPAALKAVSALITAGFEGAIAADLDGVGRVAFRMYTAERSIATRLASGALGLVAVEAGIVVGYAEVQGRGRHLAGRDHLSLLFVAPPRQRQGIGRSLLAEIVRQLSALPRPTPWLSVHAAPAAVPAYQRLGFVPTGPITRQDGLRFMPMALRLGRPADKAQTH